MKQTLDCSTGVNRSQWQEKLCTVAKSRKSAAVCQPLAPGVSGLESVARVDQFMRRRWIHATLVFMPHRVLPCALQKQHPTIVTLERSLARSPARCPAPSSPT